VNSFRVIVLGWPEAERYGSSLSEIVERKEVAAVKLSGIPRERVDLIPFVTSLDKTVWLVTEPLG
jgi:hypothetical protein